GAAPRGPAEDRRRQRGGAVRPRPVGEVNPLEQVLGRLVTANNRRIHSIDAGRPNPRPLEGLEWHDRLVAAYPAIRGEWDRFESSGGRLPMIEDLIAEHQGNEGPWRAGLLV